MPKKAGRWKVAQFSELNWWKLYFRNKDKNNYYYWKARYWQKVLDEGKQTGLKGKPLRILDAGCGPAGMFTVLESHQVDAVDPLMDAYKAKLPLFDQADYPWVNFIQSPIEDFQADPYDVIFCMNAVNHVAAILPAFQQLSKLLKKNGYIWLTIDAHNYRFFKHLFRLLPGDILHPHQFDLREYKAMTEKNIGPVMFEKNLKREFFFNHYLLIARK